MICTPNNLFDSTTEYLSPVPSLCISNGWRHKAWTGSRGPSADHSLPTQPLKHVSPIFQDTHPQFYQLHESHLPRHSSPVLSASWVPSSKTLIPSSISFVTPLCSRLPDFPLMRGFWPSSCLSSRTWHFMLAWCLPSPDDPKCGIREEYKLHFVICEVRAAVSRQ